MARNRNYRKVDGGITAWGLLCRLVMFLVFVAFGLSIVMQETRTQKIGKEINAAEEKIAELRNANLMLHAQVSELKTPKQLGRKSSAWGLNLVPVSNHQVVKCTEPTAEATLLYAQSMITEASLAADGKPARYPIRR